MCAFEQKHEVKMKKTEAGIGQTGGQCGSKYKGGLQTSVGCAGYAGLGAERRDSRSLTSKPRHNVSAHEDF